MKNPPFTTRQGNRIFIAAHILATLTKGRFKKEELLLTKN